MVYLLHFDPPYRHARHYIGYTQQLESRLERHEMGRGSPLVQAALAAGCTVTVARTWGAEGVEDVHDRSFERKLKRQKNAARLCPMCR